MTPCRKGSVLEAFIRTTTYFGSWSVQRASGDTLGAGPCPPHHTSGWLPPHLVHTCRCRQHGKVQPNVFHLRHASPDGRTTRKLSGLGLAVFGLAMAITDVSRLFNRSPRSGSGFPLWAHSRSLCDVAKHISHLLSPATLPEKFIMNSVPLITDHLLLPERAAWHLKAESYLTQTKPS